MTTGGVTASAAGERFGQVSAGERLRRWRLVLGAAAEDPVARSDNDGDRDGDGDRAGDGAGDGDGGQADGEGRSPSAVPALAGDDVTIDAALGALYDSSDSDASTATATRRRRSGRRAGGLGASQPGIVRWLGDIRTYFPTSMVQIMQRDAIERLELKQLLLEPELLASIEPDIHLVRLLVELNSVLPDTTRSTAREVIAKVLADIESRLADQTRQAVRGALARSTRTRRPRPGDIAWGPTIAANLRHWLPEHRTLIPERLIGHGRRQRSLAKDVIIAVDQSASMADSVVYAALFGGVLAQIPTLRTRLLAFDTAVTDFSHLLHDPVEVLFGMQLGGGTDIANALGVCEQMVERPRDTVLFVVSDLFEGGNVELMHRRVADLVVSGVRVVVLLALSDEGVPAYDRAQADALQQLGATVMASTPDEFAGVLAAALG